MQQVKVRAEWIDACEFHDLTENQVLREVSERVSKLKSSGRISEHPLVLLDLDSTLYEVQPRTIQILKEWLATPESHSFDQARRAIESLKETHSGYTLEDLFINLGLSPKDEVIARALKSATSFWFKRFFTSDYLKYDVAYPGAAEFSRELYALGADLIYLTGRDEPNMGDGTRANLVRDGFPWDTPRTHLLLKAAFEMSDLEHKTDAAVYIREKGKLVASFENEPPNLIALYELFPDAMHVFVDTVCSDRPALPRSGLYRIKGFSRDLS